MTLSSNSLVHFFFPLAQILGSLSVSALPTASQSSCTDLTIPVSLNAENTAVLPGLDILNLTALLDAINDISFTVPVSGTWNIAATYCEPAWSVAATTLQILVHGGTYTRSYWAGDGGPIDGYNGTTYSWVAYALSQGHATLAIDRLGNGDSDHPDPAQVVQIPLHVETIHEIVLAARAGSAPFPHSFPTIIYVGHSVGSIVGNQYNVKYPTEVDATILTGYSSQLSPSISQGVLATEPLPAAKAQPSRYSNLAPGYLEFTVKNVTELAFFYPGGFDPSLFDLDYSSRGTVSTGEVVTLFTSIAEAPEYTAPIMVITGQHDALMCSNKDDFTLPPDCGAHDTGMLAQTKALYPNSADYEWYAPPDSGHCWQLHYDAWDTFGVAHNWLAKNGF
ncbi:Alpha/Beta hydrolase protein [Xylogone sp. PMI_703]|nr:Alpha/Beta hydrolase protein [Xylogone sp. PMI_703]